MFARITATAATVLWIGVGPALAQSVDLSITCLPKLEEAGAAGLCAEDYGRNVDPTTTGSVENSVVAGRVFSGNEVIYPGMTSDIVRTTRLEVPATR